MVDSSGMPKSLSPVAVYESLLATAKRQIATTRQGKAIAEAGLGAELVALCEAIAGNAAVIIAAASEDLAGAA